MIYRENLYYSSKGEHLKTQNVVATLARFSHSHARAMEAAARERKRPREGDAAPSAAAAAREAQYVYLPIADALKAPGVRVCLFAAVAEIGATVRSRGTGEPHPSPIPFPPSSPPASPCLPLGFSLGF